MKCPKCNTTIDEEDLYCPDCGRKVDKKAQKEKKHKETKQEPIKLSKKKMTIIGILLILLFISVIVVFVIPFPYNPTEGYNIKEPFEDCRQEQASYSVEWGEWLNDKGYDYEGIEILVTNNEKESLNFGFKLAYYDTAYFGWCENTDYSKANMYSEVIYKTVPPYQTKPFQFYTKKKNPSTRYCPQHYAEQVPSIEECETKYKEVTKERTVTRYASLFKQWTGRVKWYFREGEG